MASRAIHTIDLWPP